MASVQIEQCILCKVDVSKETNKVKRKKFYSAKTDSFRKILNDISMESFAVPICDEVGMESYICHKCKHRVKALPELFRKAEHEKSQLIDLVASSFALSGRGTKRRRSPSEEISQTEINKPALFETSDKSDVQVSVSNSLSTEYSFLHIKG